MAQIFRVTQIQERKRGLVAESEVYRETLKVELQNLQLYKVHLQRKFALSRLANPLFLLAGSFAGAWLLGRTSRHGPRGRWSRLVGGLLVGWRLFRKYGPLLKSAEDLLRK